jgi:hypothetical protein
MCKNAQWKNQPLGGALTSDATAYCSLARQSLGLLGGVARVRGWTRRSAISRMTLWPSSPQAHASLLIGRSATGKGRMCRMLLPYIGSRLPVEIEKGMALPQHLTRLRKCPRQLAFPEADLRLLINEDAHHLRIDL